MSNNDSNSVNSSSNLLIDKYPNLIASEWDYELNIQYDINVNKITCGSGVKAWWHCDTCNGRYEMKVSSKIYGQGCPYCAGQRVLKGFNDFASKYPDLVMNEWDWSKNKIRPDEITCGSGLKAWWRCKQYRHSYQMQICKRTCCEPRGCPYCSGHKVLKGFNDLQTKYPELIESEWDYANNNANNLHPDEIACGTRTQAWWRCKQYKHSYQMSVFRKTCCEPRGCPYCAGKQVLVGFNDLQSKYPELIKNEWDWSENDKHGLKPDEITFGSNFKANWYCNTCNGKYEMMINSKTSGYGCPYCAGKQVLVGFNDLQSKYPELIKNEWDWIKNNKNNLKPDEITYGSHRKAWWKCSYNNSHSWYAAINSRTYIDSTGCPKCSYKISKQEDEVAEYIKSYLLSYYINIKYSMFRSIKFSMIYRNLVIDIDSVLNNVLRKHLLKELDIYIPELGFAVEYDGDYWHDDKMMLSRCGLTNDEAHSIKQELCEQAGIELLIITEHDWLNNNEKVKKIINERIDDSVKNMV